MDPHCFGSLQVCATRVGKLDVNGAPDPGANNGYVTDALIQAGVTLDIRDGDEFELINGCGGICQTFKDCDRILRASISLELCTLDSELISLLLPNGQLFTDTGTGDAIGFELPPSDEDCPFGTSLELWTKAWDQNQQATPPFLGGSTIAYFRFFFPKVRWQLGDLTLENEILRLPVNGIAEENDQITVNGPFNDFNVDVAAQGGITNVGGWFLDGTIPTAQCGFIPVPAGS